MSNHKNHTWNDETTPPNILPHSLAKHRVLQAYLEEYVSVLTKNPRQERLKLTLVDGFAGGGKYREAITNQLHDGSPLLMLKAMNEAARKAQQYRIKPFELDIDYYFIEQNQNTFSFLENTIRKSEFAHLLTSGKIHLINSNFSQQCDSIIKDIKAKSNSERAIFFLDQFGYKDVPLPTIRKILSSLKKAEVLLTFATDYLIDYLSQSEISQRILQNVGLSIPTKTITDAKNHANWRRFIQVCLHKDIPRKTNARFYTPFFIRSKEAHRDFWLIHLSGHSRARDVMVGLHWANHTSFAHYGESGLNMLGYDQDFDPNWTKQPTLPGFFFDETALESSRTSLQVELPERIHAYDDGIAFDALFSSLTNETPVTSKIMKSVLNELAAEGHIIVKDQTGLTTRQGKIQRDDDIIYPSRQLRLFTN